jgi:hypothetical protein
LRLATPDFHGIPMQDQDFRCFRDISEDIKILVTFRMAKPKKSVIMRVSRNSSQEAIEQVFSKEWRTNVQFQKKCPSVLDSNEIYWMKQARIIADLADDCDTQPMPEESEAPTGLRAIPFRGTPIIAPVSCTRSLSADDLAGGTKDTPLKTDFLATWIIKFGLITTQRDAPENTPVDAVCDQAAREFGTEIKHWTKTLDRRGSAIHRLRSVGQVVARLSMSTRWSRHGRAI